MTHAPAAVPEWPSPTFAVLGARHELHAAAPRLIFDMEVQDASSLDVYTIALSVQINIDPARRSYDSETRRALTELFGAPDRWAATTRSFLWTRADLLVPSFTATGRFALNVPCTYDLELAAVKYFYALPDGLVPLTFHFSGTALYREQDGRLQMVQIPWSCSTRWQMPIATWRAMVDYFYPGSGWIALRSDTLAALHERRTALGLPTSDACVAELLANAEDPKARP